MKNDNTGELLNAVLSRAVHNLWLSKMAATGLHTPRGVERQIQKRWKGKLDEAIAVLYDVLMLTATEQKALNKLAIKRAPPCPFCIHHDLKETISSYEESCKRGYSLDDKLTAQRGLTGCLDFERAPFTNDILTRHIERVDKEWNEANVREAIGNIGKALIKSDF